MRPCASPKTLAAYENGELGDALADPLQHHLDQCAPCQALMDRIRGGNREVKALRGAFQASRAGGDTPPFAGFSDSGRGLESPGADGEVSDWIIPDYERVLLCGEGSYGSVWAVRDRVGVYRALKIIDLKRMTRAGVGCRERNALETYCRRISRHPYLITIFHIGVAGRYLYYTMELADDQNKKGAVRDNLSRGYRPLTLDTIVRGRRLNPDVAMEIAHRLLRGLSKLHGVDLVHRDIKPSNIVFVNRQPKLADIGMITSDDDQGRPIGTPRYMPPDRVMDRTADTYAFGKVLHEMIAGPRADTFPALPANRRWGSARWDMARINDLLVRACSDRAADRYPTASEMLEDLEACADLAFTSLFNELEDTSPPVSSSRSRAPVQIALAVIRIIPWILAFVVILKALSYLG